MKYHISIIFFLILSFSLSHSIAQEVDKPTPLKEHKSYPWFKQSFLDLQDDISDAKENNKGLILYFHQDGCPYCKKLLNDNFSRTNLVTKLRNQYDFIAINLWGDKDVVDFDGSELTEKSLAVKLKVMFTPSLVFFNAQGEKEFRLNGYYSPEKFNYLLDYLAIKPRTQSFTQYYKHKVKSSRDASLTNKTIFAKINNYQKIAVKSTKPVLILFEESNCTECDELHQIIEDNSAIKKLFGHFTPARVSIHSREEIIDIDGNSNTLSQWSNQLKIQHTPTLVFYTKSVASNKMKEVFRVESYLKAFHLESVLLYIYEKHYIEFPEFQRYIHERVDQLEEKGIKIELWK